MSCPVFVPSSVLELLFSMQICPLGFSVAFLFRDLKHDVNSDLKGSRTCITSRALFSTSSYRPYRSFYCSRTRQVHTKLYFLVVKLSSCVQNPMVFPAAGQDEGLTGKLSIACRPSFISERADAAFIKVSLHHILRVKEKRIFSLIIVTLSTSP